MRVIIGTTNPAKIDAVKEVFKTMTFEYSPIDIASGVKEQPFSDEETIGGAINRAEGALKAGVGDIGIGLEGGVHETSHGMFLCNWGALAEKGYPSLIAGGARILLPVEIAERLRIGEELGPVMDEYAGKQNIRKHEGAVGIFTKGMINRREMFEHIVRLLLGQYEYRKEQR